MKQWTTARLYEHLILFQYFQQRFPMTDTVIWTNPMFGTTRKYINIKKRVENYVTILSMRAYWKDIGLPLS